MSSISSLRLLSSIRTCSLRVARSSTGTTSTHKTADPAVHSEPPQGQGGLEETPDEDEYRHDPHYHQEPHGKQSDYKPPLDPPFSSPKIENNNPINPPVGPTFQQKRRSHYSHGPAVLADVECVGVDGSTPLKGGGGGRKEIEEVEEGRSREEEYREYFKDRKASPLSEIEFADTRKPISRAVDGEKRDDVWGGKGIGYMVEDTTDDSLAKAEAMFMAAKLNDDPDSPQARALARKLWERYRREEAEFDMFQLSAFKLGL